MRNSRLLPGWSLAGLAGLLAGCASWDRERVDPAADATAHVEWKANESRAVIATIRPVAAATHDKADQAPKREPFQLPSGLPGAGAPPISLPPLKDLTPAEREKKVREAFPELPPLPASPQAVMPASGQPFGLADLQMLALAQSPAIRRAGADVDAAQGAMIQAGLYPNPHVGYQGDQIQPGSKPSNNSGQQGAFIQQLIKTAGKLGLARAAAGMDFANAQLAQRKAQLDVIAQVRSGYFNVLVAQETMRAGRSLAELADEVYALQLKLVASGEAASYEPLQLYTQAVQARNNFIQARNRYLASWKQLAASLGTPDLIPHELSGKVDDALPRYDEELARARIVEGHTDVLTAQNTILQAQYNLRLAHVTPIPDIATATVVQHDNSTGNGQFSVQVGVALPLFDRNQGNIRAARAQLARATEDLRARQNDLSGRLAEAFGRYQTSQAVAANYRDRVLPNLSRAYRAVYQRYQQEPQKVSFNDIVVAQQNLAQALSAYLGALGDQWTATVDVANLLQIDDLYEPAEAPAPKK